MWCSLPRPLVCRSAFDEYATGLCALGIIDSHRAVPLVCPIPRLVLWRWWRGHAVLAQIRGGGLRAWNGLQRRQAGLPTFPCLNGAPREHR